MNGLDIFLVCLVVYFAFILTYALYLWRRG